jgi:hypothetical protein
MEGASPCLKVSTPGTQAVCPNGQAAFCCRVVSRQKKIKEGLTTGDRKVASHVIIRGGLGAAMKKYISEQTNRSSDSILST